MIRVFVNSLRDWDSISSLVILKTQKIVLDASLLNLSIIWYESRVSGAIQRKK